MTINAAWTDADTVALKSMALDLARQFRTFRAGIAHMRRIVGDNEITIGEIADDDGGDPAALIGPVPKQAIWDILNFDDQMELLLTNRQPTDLGFWGAKLGKIVKV